MSEKQEPAGVLTSVGADSLPDDMLAVITAAIRTYEAHGTRGTRRPPPRTFGTRPAVTYGTNVPHPLIRSVCGSYEVSSGVKAVNPTVRNCD